MWLDMQHISPQSNADHGRRETVVILGGKGGFASRYRELAEEQGYELEHYERRVPPSSRLSTGRVALVLVIVSMISHPLRDQARKLAGPDTAVVYVNRASISAVRESLQQARATRVAAAVQKPEPRHQQGRAA